MKITEWYMRNWQYENEAETGKAKLVYKGEYYQIRSGSCSRVQLKVIYLGAVFVLWALIIFLLSHISRGASLIFVGAPMGIAMFPAIYMLMGAVSFAQTSQYLTYRDLKSSIWRIRLSSKWMLGFFLVSFAGELFYLGYRMLNHLLIAWNAEIIWVIGSALAAGVSITVLRLLERYHEELCPMGLK